MSAVFYSVTESSIIGILASALICVLAFFSTVEDYFVLIFGLQFLGRAILVSFGSSQFGFILFVYAVLFFKFLINKRAVSVEYLLIFLLLILDIYTSAYAGVFKIGDNINWVFSLLYAVFIIKNCVLKIDFQNMKTLGEVYQKLKRRYLKTEFIITLGENGALYCVNNQIKITPSLKVNVIDSHGSKDAFCIGFAYSIVNEQDLEKAVKYGSIAGGLATTKIGARLGIPTLEDVKKIYDQNY